MLGYEALSWVATRAAGTARDAIRTRSGGGRRLCERREWLNDWVRKARADGRQQLLAITCVRDDRDEGFDDLYKQPRRQLTCHNHFLSQSHHRHHRTDLPCSFHRAFMYQHHHRHTAKPLPPNTTTTPLLLHDIHNPTTISPTTTTAQPSRFDPPTSAISATTLLPSHPDPPLQWRNPPIHSSQ
jgi:hypothetical protein